MASACGCVQEPQPTCRSTVRGRVSSVFGFGSSLLLFSSFSEPSCPWTLSWTWPCSVRRLLSPPQQSRCWRDQAFPEAGRGILHSKKSRTEIFHQSPRQFPVIEIGVVKALIASSGTGWTSLLLEYLPDRLVGLLVLRSGMRTTTVTRICSLSSTATVIVGERLGNYFLRVL